MDLTLISRLVQAGLGNLAAYLAAHVLLCLVPAFFIAGALSVLMPKEAVTKYLGPDAPKWISYPAAAIGASLLAVCSCTIVPLFASIYKKGAGLGPAITFLFIAPAVNILAIAYTGVALGMELAVSRIVLGAAFGIGIGMIMALIFRKDDIENARMDDGTFKRGATVPPRVWRFLILLVALLLVGTLKWSVLSTSYGQFTLPVPGVDRLQELLFRLVPFDAARGEEGVSVQGVLLIGLLIAIGAASFKGLTDVLNGMNRWTTVSLGLIALTLVTGAARLVPLPTGLQVGLTGRMFAVMVLIVALWYYARHDLDVYEMQEWLWETWRFVRQIFPLLVVGVFVVGLLRPLIRPEWIESLAGRNTLLGNLVGVLFGVFMYFPTLVEVPIAKLFLSLGMHPGPLIAYLMSDPELSLQSILMISAIIGKAKAWTYVAWVALFSLLSGLLYGAWQDGASLLHVLGLLAAGMAVLIAALNWMGHRAGARSEAQV